MQNSLHENLREAEKNPVIPGARLLHKEDARKLLVNSTGAAQWFYPLSEGNDMGLFSYIKKDAVSDSERPWTVQAHPEVNLYFLILKGSGTAVLGGGLGFTEETYEFGARDLLIIPRGVPYRLTGGWEGLCFHARIGVFGAPSGPSRFPHPVLTFNRPDRPTQKEKDAQFEPGSFRFIDPLYSRALIAEPPYLKGEVIPAEGAEDAGSLLLRTTPRERQALDPAGQGEVKKNPSVMGARVLRKSDAPDFYNANAGSKQWMYPMGWTDDLAVFCGFFHSKETDIDRPFDSHSHPDVEECKYIISGSGWIKFGVGDSAFETESYEFREGDLIINPRSVPHLEGGTYEAVVWHTKSSCFGKIPGTSQYPHVAYVYTKPPRPTPEEEAATNDPGTYILMDSRETTNVYQPNPILRVEKNPTDMTYLRPDLFEKEKEHG